MIIMIFITSPDFNAVVVTSRLYTGKKMLSEKKWLLHYAYYYTASSLPDCKGLQGLARRCICASPVSLAQTMVRLDLIRAR